MADVLIVCVREDEPQAKALAEMFEAAGFSIGGAPSSDGALRSSGAGVVVWSQASIRSRPFLDAAQRVINANKAVVASLIDPPPPSSIGDSPAFDLSRWDGDPNDPSLDPLFFTVDRMVNAARASVGAPAAREDVYEAPPPPQRAAPRAAPLPPPARPAPAPAPAPNDPLGAEAEHWRAIRDSRNPADFMDYLSRYGAHGAFAEVAELRLKQLTAGAGAAPPPRAAPAPRPAPAPPRPAPPPAPRYAERPEPRRETPPPRRMDPPSTPRYAERSEPRRMPPPERSYDRADLREPTPSQGGGAMRAFILIALLGGAALAGGLYFGGGMGDIGGAAPTEQTDRAPATAALDTPSGTPLAESSGEVETATAPQVLDDRSTQQASTQRDDRREQQRREQQQRREEEQRRLAELNRAAEPQPPRNVPTSSTPSGPVSLQPGSNGSVGPSLDPPSSVTQIPPAAQTASVTQPPATTRAPPAGAVQWAQRPSSRRIAELYPDRALREGTGGRVQLDCTVQASMAVACSVASESPAGQGFGRAALSAANSYRAGPTLSNGQSSVGARTRIAVAFQAPQ